MGDLEQQILKYIDQDADWGFINRHKQEGGYVTLSASALIEAVDNIKALVDAAVVEALEKLKGKAAPLNHTEDFVYISDIDSTIAALSKRQHGA